MLNFNTLKCNALPCWSAPDLKKDAWRRGPERLSTSCIISWPGEVCQVSDALHLTSHVWGTAMQIIGKMQAIKQAPSHSHRARTQSSDSQQKFFHSKLSFSVFFYICLDWSPPDHATMIPQAAPEHKTFLFVKLHKNFTSFLFIMPRAK